MEAKILREFKGQHCSLALRSDGILQVGLTPDLTYDEQEAISVINDIYDFTENRKYLILVLSAKYSNITVEAMRVLATEKGMGYALAKAYVIDSLPQKIMANFYLRVFKSVEPVKFFKTKEEAEIWLLSLYQ